MFKRFPVPPSFSLIKKRKTFFLLKNQYRDLLLQQGIEDIEVFLKRNLQTTRYVIGRSHHPSVPIREGERMVVRRYSHGGLFGPLTRNLYLFDSRSFRELALTEEIRSWGIPTVEPIAALHQLTLFPFYKAYLLSLEVPRAIDLIQYFQKMGHYPSLKDVSKKRKIIRSAGLLLRQFHDSGFFHGDLHLKNILIAGEQLLLIDFDRSYRKSVLTIGERMRNLLRLNRSVEKWKLFGLPITWMDRWRFCSAYAGDDVKIKAAVRRTIRTYPIRHLFYRMEWALQRLLGS
jgi:hypothetical protein